MATNIGNSYGGGAFAKSHDQVSPDAFYESFMHAKNGWEGASPRLSESFHRANGELAGNNGPSVLDQWRQDVLGKIMGYHGHSDASTQNGPSMFSSGGYNHDPSPGPQGVSVIDPQYSQVVSGAFESPDRRPQVHQANISQQGAQGPDALWPRSYDRRG